MKKSSADQNEKSINERTNEFAREYDTLPRRDPRRAEIANLSFAYGSNNSKTEPHRESLELSGYSRIT